MAQKVRTVLVDDLDGSPADETVEFSIDGRHYEIDLTKDHAKEMRAAFKVYTRKARPVDPPKPSAETKKIREWAAQNGYQVSARGRIHRDVIEAYRNAQK